MKVATGILIVLILTGLFIYTCIIFKIIQDCQVIGFESKVCDKSYIRK